MASNCRFAGQLAQFVHIVKRILSYLGLEDWILGGTAVLAPGNRDWLRLNNGDCGPEKPLEK